VRVFEAEKFLAPQEILVLEKRGSKKGDGRVRARKGRCRRPRNGSGSAGAHNLLENGAGTRGRRDNERILVVVQVQEAYIERKKWGRQRSPQCIYTYKQRVARTELATTT